jgi:hypothetical protein
VEHGFLHPFLDRQMVWCLINGIAYDKHVVDANTDQEEGQQRVNTGNLLPG